MKITKEEFQTVGKQHELSEETLNRFWSDLESRNTSGLNVPNLAYYLGAMVIISAMGWFMTEAWDDESGWAITLLGGLYFGIFALAGHFMYRKSQLKIPGGLLLTVAVSVVPLLVYGIEEVTGFWPDSQIGYGKYHSKIDSSWIIMEVVTFLVGVAFLLKYRFTFLTFPVTLALWYMSMDLAPLILGNSYRGWEQRAWISLGFGLVMLIATYFIDRRTKQDFAFWGYLFGLMAFWGGMSSLHNDGETGKFIYCLINLGLMFVAVFLQRRVFLVFGAIGIFLYLGYLANRVFEDSLLFPIFLTILGLSIIMLGVLYHSKRNQIDAWMQKMIPDSVKRFAPGNRIK